LGDVLIMLGLRYGEDASLELAASVMRTISHAAYRASVELAREKGPFPFFERDAYLAGGFVSALPADIRDGIASSGTRNSHLTAIAPTGTVSLLANNVSSGLEPVFDRSYTRRVLERDGSFADYRLTDYAVALWQDLRGSAAPLPEAFVDARRIAPKQHIAMQAALQPYVDSAISKTINVPANFDFVEFESLYAQAFAEGLKGCTTFRVNPVTGEVLSSAVEPAAAPHCCTIEREAD
jgi:ribonucleoside-diphosphate reductase alpha chain